MANCLSSIYYTTLGFGTVYVKIMDRVVRPEKVHTQIADKALEENFLCYGCYVVALLQQATIQNRQQHIFFLDIVAVAMFRYILI